MNSEQIKELKNRWTNLCNQNYEKMGDVGTCVLGAGLSLNGVVIISTWDVCRVQGNLVWETGLDQLLNDFNLEFKTNIIYEYGCMD